MDGVRDVAVGDLMRALIYATESDARRSLAALERVFGDEETVTLHSTEPVPFVRPRTRPLTLPVETRDGWALPLPDAVADVVEERAALLPRREVEVDGERVPVPLMSARVDVELRDEREPEERLR